MSCSILAAVSRFFRNSPAHRLGKIFGIFVFVSLGSSWFGLSEVPLDVRAIFAGRAAAGGTTEKKIDSALLKTDTEVDRLFSKAGEFADRGRFDLASVLWQKVLDDFGENLITRDEWKMETLDNSYRKYLTVREDLESRLPSLDARALDSYRLTADAEAKALLASSKRDPSIRTRALNEVVRRYFLSSVGDDAAYELGCLKMERNEFFPALYYFSRILDSHPDPSIPRGEIMMRIAAARAFAGNAIKAGEEVKALQENPGTIDPVALRAVSREVQSIAGESGSVDTNRHRDNPALPEGILSTHLSEDWVQPFKLDAGELAGLFRDRPAENPKGTQMSRGQLLQAWRGETLLPSGRILVEDDRLYFKNANRLVCVDGATGRIKWLGHPNDFAYDKRTLQARQERQKAALFNDRVHQAMAIWGEKIFVLQGRPQDIGGKPPLMVVSGSSRMQFPGRHRNNWLTAYHKVDGRLRWSRQAVDKDDDETVEACFIGGPAFYESLMLIPILKDGAIYLSALNPEDGETIWTSFLCRDPMGAVRSECPVKVVIDAGETYVATGSGVVFALEALSGSVRWCLRYPRSGTRTGRNTYQPATIMGWSEDDLVVSGDRLVVLSCDMDYVFSLNRSDGSIAWESPRFPFGDSTAGSYLIGEVGGKLFVGGPRVIRCYDVQGGKLLWQTGLDKTSYGRGTVAGDSIYLPVDKSIIQVSMADGKILDEATFTSPTPEPIGNLNADGQRLYGFGLERVYAFGGLTQRFQKLAKLISSGDAEAYRTRMRLYLQAGNQQKALEDFKGHFDYLVRKGEPIAAGHVVYDGITELSILENDPSQAIGWVQRESSASSSVPESEATAGLRLRRNWVLSGVFNRIERQGAEVPVDQLVKVAPFCRETYLVDGGRRAVAKSIKPGDVPRLQSALADGDSMEKIFAASGLRAQIGEAAGDNIRTALESAQDSRLKLYLATDLINLGDRQALTTLSGLLGQEAVTVRRSAIMRLRQVSGESFPFDANASGDELTRGVAAWEKWARGDGLTAKLNLPVGEHPPYRGHTLAMARPDRGSYAIIELDGSGKEIRKTDFKRQPYGMQKLPNGNILLSSNDWVREYSPGGEQVWDLGRPPGGYNIARRLPNGNTVVGTYGPNITEYKPDGSVEKVWLKGKERGWWMPIEITGEGGVLVADSKNQRVYEILRDGSTPWELKLNQKVNWACRGADGTTVVVISAQSRVEAYSRDKKKLWTVSGLISPRFVQALPNGNTVVLHQKGIVEVDNQGKVINRTSTPYLLIYRF